MVRDPCDDVGEPAAKAYVSKLRAVEAEADDDDEDDDDQNNTNNRDSRVSEHLKQEMMRLTSVPPNPNPVGELCVAGVFAPWTGPLDLIMIQSLSYIYPSVSCRVMPVCPHAALADSGLWGAQREARGYTQRKLAHRVVVPEEHSDDAVTICKGHKSAVTAMALSRDGGTAFSSSKDGAIFQCACGTTRCVGFQV